MNLTNKRIGILGGTFDPVHNGHIACAKHVASWLQLNEVLLLPSHIPPHKSEVTAQVLDRKNMLSLICQDNKKLKLDERELNKNTISYTVETLREYKQEFPRSSLYFIIGMDSLINFSSWYHWQEILTLCHLVVCSRPGYSVTNEKIKVLSPYIVNNITSIIHQQSGGILFTPEIAFEISSSQIRKKIKHQQNIDDLIPCVVKQYIERNNIY